MAKANKSGLGRGLNSLLGGAFEEAAPLESTPKRVLVEQQREETAVPIPMPNPWLNVRMFHVKQSRQ